MLTAKVTPALIASIKTPQCREILHYLFTTYGVETPIDQNELLIEMNSHQHDGKVLRNGSAGPISRIYEFYRKRGLTDPGYMTVSKENATVSVNAEMKALRERVAELEALLDEATESDESTDA
jgi:hypothetical protein